MGDSITMNDVLTMWHELRNAEPWRQYVGLVEMRESPYLPDNMALVTFRDPFEGKRFVLYNQGAKRHIDKINATEVFGMIRPMLKPDELAAFLYWQAEQQAIERQRRDAEA